MAEPLIVLGIDGLDWRYIDAHRSELPTLATWPVLLPLQSIFPPDSIPAWTTIFTGVPPGDHGMLDSIDYLDARPAQAAERAGEKLAHRTFWDEAGRRDKRVCVVNPFLAYPAWDVNGIMVSGPVFVSGAVSSTGIAQRDLGRIPELGGIVFFPLPRRWGRSSRRHTCDPGASRIWHEDAGSSAARSLLSQYPHRGCMQHFAWRFADIDDPTYPGPTRHATAILRTYELVDALVARYAHRGRVLVCSDHGHGRRCTRMLFLDEVLRRAGLVTETARGPRILSSAYVLERAKRLALVMAYRFEFEAAAYRLARKLPNRKAIKQSTFSTDAASSPARLSRLFGRNQFGGIELRDDTPQMRACVADVLTLSSIRQPDAGCLNGSGTARRLSLAFPSVATHQSSSSCSRATVSTSVSTGTSLRPMSTTGASRAGTRISACSPAHSICRHRLPPSRRSTTPCLACSERRQCGSFRSTSSSTVALVPRP